jgi:hypothetical protein
MIVREHRGADLLLQKASGRLEEIERTSTNCGSAGAMSKDRSSRQSRLCTARSNSSASRTRSLRRRCFSIARGLRNLQARRSGRPIRRRESRTNVARTRIPNP